MEENHILLGGSTAACRHAGEILREFGLPMVHSTGPKIRYVLLDIPSFQSNGTLRSGSNMESLLEELPKDVILCGGNLQHPGLTGFDTIDFLKDETYLCENAYITAECALDVAFPYLKRTIRGCSVLIIGWGRIGKCLGQLLKNIGANVTIAARNPVHRAMIHALGYDTLDFDTLLEKLETFDLLYNTVPSPVLDREQLSLCREACIKIELASKDGLEGDDIIIARGLPGIHMPESSGQLIAETFLRLCYGR